MGGWKWKEKGALILPVKTNVYCASARYYTDIFASRYSRYKISMQRTKNIRTQISVFVYILFGFV